jgi:hypothetical protein
VLDDFDPRFLDGVVCAVGVAVEQCGGKADEVALMTLGECAQGGVVTPSELLEQLLVGWLAGLV